MKVTLRCPVSHEPFTAQLKEDFATLTQNWNKEISIPCPRCKGFHEEQFNTLFTEAILQSVNLTDFGIKQPQPKGGANARRKRVPLPQIAASD